MPILAGVNTHKKRPPPGNNIGVRALGPSPHAGIVAAELRGCEAAVPLLADSGRVRLCPAATTSDTWFCTSGESCVRALSRNAERPRYLRVVAGKASDFGIYVSRNAENISNLRFVTKRPWEGFWGGEDCVEKAPHVEVADVGVENTRMERAEGWRLR